MAAIIVNKQFAIGTSRGRPSSISAGTLAALKRRAQERCDLPAIHVFIGRFSGGVVAAREHDDFMIQAVSPEFLHRITRELRQKSHVVLGIDDEGFLGPARKLAEIRYWTDRAP